MYIARAIQKIKTIELEDLVDMKARGIKQIRCKLESPEEIPAGKKLATMVVPIHWIIAAREAYDMSGRKSESAFQGFVSDWISGWV